ncbi:MAG TPA: DinB family protein [Anaerolineales bacterium]|nr:DinB family protein [Anaerolineales bacterium]
MPTPANKTQLINAIADLPDQVARFVAKLTPEQLTAHPIPGEWSIAQNVHHLCDSHMNSYVRCKLILTEQNPPLKPYDQDAWAELSDSTSSDLGSSLILLRGLHNRWVEFWLNLPESAWERTGIHPEHGQVNLAQILQSYVQHGLGHIEQMQRNVDAM